MDVFLEKSAEILSVVTVSKNEVRNLDGEHLGNIEGLMVDMDTGRVQCAVLSSGGFLGPGNKLFPIPWPMLQIDPKDYSFTVDMDRKTLVHAPGFDKDGWPKTMESDWLVKLYHYYDFDPLWPFG